MAKTKGSTDSDLQIVLDSIKNKICIMDADETAGATESYKDSCCKGKDTLTMKDYEDSQEKKMAHLPESMRQRVVDVKVRRMKKKDRNNDNVITQQEYLTHELWYKLDASVTAGNADFDWTLSKEELQKWLKNTQGGCGIPECQVKACAAAVVKGFYKEKDGVDPYELTEWLFEKAFPVDGENGQQCGADTSERKTLRS